MFRGVLTLTAVALILAGVAQAVAQVTIDGVFMGMVGLGGLMILADAMWDRAHA